MKTARRSMPRGGEGSFFVEKSCLDGGRGGTSGCYDLERLICSMMLVGQESMDQPAQSIQISTNRWATAYSAIADGCITCTKPSIDCVRSGLWHGPRWSGGTLGFSCLGNHRGTSMTIRSRGPRQRLRGRRVAQKGDAANPVTPQSGGTASTAAAPPRTSGATTPPPEARPSSDDEIVSVLHSFFGLTRLVALCA